MGILRTNYRTTGGVPEPLMLGQAFFSGSAGGGPGVANKTGLIFGSWSGTATSYGSTTGLVSIEAASVIASYYGCDKLPVDGYKVRLIYYPVMASLAGSANFQQLLCSLSTSTGASQILIWAGGSTVSVFGCDWSAHFRYVGLIISAP